MPPAFPESGERLFGTLWGQHVLDTRCKCRLGGGADVASGVSNDGEPADAEGATWARGLCTWGPQQQARRPAGIPP